MKILIVSYHYLPEQNPRVFRWSSIVSHLILCGHAFSVITSSDNNKYKKDGESMHIIRVPENLIGRIRSKISKKYISNIELNESKSSMHGDSKLISKWIKFSKQILIIEHVNLIHFEFITFARWDSIS